MKNNLVIGIVIVVVVILAGCLGSGGSKANGNIVASDSPTVTVYKSASCGCCGGYSYEMGRNGFEVEEVNVQNLATVKQKYNIPSSMQSCHTSVIGNYFVEGHVPIEAVNKLLAEQPDIDGIALPDMPSGSPGMPGSKKEPFTIYALKDGSPSVFMTI